MESIIKTLESLPDALRSWQANYESELEKRERRITELEQEVKSLAQAALPQVSVAGTLKSADSTSLDVEWKVTSSTDIPVKVNVRHTDTNTGKEQEHVWDVTKEAAGVYVYPLDKVTGNVSFTILPGEGYTIGTATANVPVSKASAPAPGVYKPEQGNPTPQPKQLQFPNINFNQPFKITKGGTYKGDWESKNTEVPAVDVLTQEPVVIEQSHIAGAGYLVKHWAGKANIVIRNTRGYGLEPTAWKDYMKPRRFLAVAGFRNVVIENCEMLQTAGILLGGSYQGNGSETETFKIRRNLVRNIDGRIMGGKDKVQFFQTNFRGAVQHAEVCWNEVINEPGKSAVEDNINIYNTRGTEASPIRIHHNYIQGAFPVPATSSKYSGGGIITDGDGDLDTCTAHIEAYENHLVGLGNYSMGMAGGNNLHYHHNRVINAGKFDDGSKYPFYVSSLWGNDYYKKGTTFANLFENNFVAANHWLQNGFSVLVNCEERNNTFQAAPTTKQQEREEWALWQQALRTSSIKIGI